LFLASGARRGCWRCQIQSIPTPPRPHHASLSGALLLEQDGSGATLVRMMMMIGTGEPDHNVRMDVRPDGCAEIRMDIQGREVKDRW
jgi:hypothetical protein